MTRFMNNSKSKAFQYFLSGVIKKSFFGLASYAFTRLIIGTALKSIIKDINKMKQKLIQMTKE